MEAQIASSAVPFTLASMQPSTELSLPELPRLSALLQEFVTKLPQQPLKALWAGIPGWPQYGGEIVGW